MNMLKRHKAILFTLLAVCLLVGGTTVFSKTITEKISARFANIKLIVNDQVIQTKAEPFIYNGNVYAPVATVANALQIHQEWDNKTPAVRFAGGGPISGIPDSVLQQAKRNLPLPCDGSDPKGSMYFCSPDIEVLSKGFVNLSGTSNQEFLVLYRYKSPEGVPFEAYLTLYRLSNEKAVAINTVELYKGETAMDPGDVVYDAQLKKVYVHRFAFKYFSEGNTSRFGKGDLLEAAVVEVQNGKLVKTGLITKP